MMRKHSFIDHLHRPALLFFMIFLFISPSIADQAEQIQQIRVLIINSYHKGFPWTDNIVKSVESVLEKEQIDVDLRIEYMDSKVVRYDSAFRKRLFDLYIYKYKDQKFDFIFTTDDDALNFVREYHEDIFPRTKVVFCGVNNIMAADLVDRKLFTGILEISAEKETIELILKLHPQTKRLIMIVDTTNSGNYRWKQVEKIFHYFPEIEFIRLDDSYFISEIEDKMKNLSDDTIAIFAVLSRDKSGRYISLKEGLSRISKTSARPVYTFLLQDLKYGAIGGKLTSGEQQGKKMAEIFLQIHRGEKVQNIPVVKESLAEFIFDYSQLKRFNIQKSLLPPQSSIINKPFSFYDEYKIVVWISCLSFFILIVIIIILFFNTVKRVRAEKNLKKSLANLERSNQELDQFAYVASHDLQEPLRMVSSYTQLLAKRYKDKLDDDANDFINFAVEGATRMQGLIISLLEYSRVTTKGILLEKIECNKLIKEILKYLEESIKENKVEITFTNLPSIFGDETHIFRVFLNLIQNAIKFRNKHDIPMIHILSKKEKNCYMFSVKDNGIGIEKEFFDEIFIIFKRLHSRENYQGNGMGLSISKKIIERHGGRIWLESEPGNGTIFYFTIPIKKGDIDE